MASPFLHKSYNHKSAVVGGVSVFMGNRLPIILLSALILLVVSGAAFLGLFSCGGYVWHRQAIYSVIVGAVVLCTLKPAGLFAGKFRRLLIPVFAAILFVAVRGAASAFYPAYPDSLTSFLKLMWAGIIHGPC